MMNDVQQSRSICFSILGLGLFQRDLLPSASRCHFPQVAFSPNLCYNVVACEQDREIRCGFTEHTRERIHVAVAPLG